MFHLYYITKNSLNYLFDRLIDTCDLILMDGLTLPLPRRAAYRLARWLGDVCLLLRDFPRVSAWELCINGRRVIFVGDHNNLSDMNEIILEGSDQPRELGRVALWNLPKQSRAWLAQGVELVVCQLSRRSPWQPTAPVHFDVPTWVNMSLPLPNHLEDLLKGNKRERVRRRVKKGLEAGFAYRYSHAKNDFSLFHYRMYRPFISARYGSHAALSTYKDQWERTYKHGGLIMVTLEDRPVAGTLCYIANGTAYSVERGILDAKPDLMDKEVNGIIDWFTMNWAHQNGVQSLNLGGTRPWRSDGVFLYKRQWGARIIQRRKIYPVWRFLANRVSPDLEADLNRLGFVSEVGNRFYGVQVNGYPVPVPAECLEAYWQDWSDEGVDGVMIVSPCHPPILYPQQDENHARQPVPTL